MPVYYEDKFTGDKVPEDIGPATFLIAHDPETTFMECLDPNPGKEEKDFFLRDQ